jgi:secreted trypsin-like serine protease
VPWFICGRTLSGSALAAPTPPPVVGGRAVAHGEFPDVVAVLTEQGGLCSGTLLGADLVLTAAHCIDLVPREVIVGAIDLAKPDGQRRSVKWSRAYPNWLERYDAGVIMLENPVFARQRAVAQGCTAKARLNTGASVEVVGFGLTTKSGRDANTRLHAATLEVVDPTCATDPACEPAVAPGGEFTAGGHGVDACFGDSGGPVYIETAHGPALVGIVSRGLLATRYPCGDGGVFVRADKLVAWIQNVTGRRLDRVPCDLPGDDPGSGSGSGGEDGDDDGVLAAVGCSAASGLVHSGFAAVYAVLCIAGLRRARRRRRDVSPR